MYLKPEAWPELWAEARDHLRDWLRNFAFSPFALLAFGALLLCCVTCMPLTCCCARPKRRKSRLVAVPSSRSRVGLDKAEEAGVRAPLMGSASFHQPPARFGQVEVSPGFSRDLFLKRHNIRPADESPPPPRRCTAGQTLIVPLTGLNRHHVRPGIPLLGTPDSRVTSFEGGTTKSCATIPEDDELELDEDEMGGPRLLHDDLISIDRTYISSGDYKSLASRPRPLDYHRLTDPLTPPPNRSTVPSNPPSYAPPAPPRPDTIYSTPTRKSLGQSNLSSPEGLSCGFGSTVDTCGSESCAVTMESEPPRQVYYNNGEKVVITEIDDSSAESLLRNIVLHRIEEEDQFEDASSLSRLAGSPSATGLAKYNTGPHRIPRSISQQLELMNGRG